MAESRSSDEAKSPLPVETRVRLSPPPRVEQQARHDSRSSAAAWRSRWLSFFALALTAGALYGVFVWLPSWADSREPVVQDLTEESPSSSVQQANPDAQAPEVRVPEDVSVTEGRSADARRKEEPLVRSDFSPPKAPSSKPATEQASPVPPSVRRKSEPSIHPGVKAAMTQGLAALGASDFEKAEGAFRQALRLDSAFEAAEDGLFQAQQGAKLERIARAKELGSEYEASERWEEAVAVYEEVIEQAGDVSFARQGLVRSRSRAELAAKLEAHLGRRDRLATLAVRQEAEGVWAAASSLSGPTIEQQAARLRQAIDEAAQTLPVVLTSDGKTVVQLYRVGELGLFTEHSLDLPPGRYTAVGRRAGYRDVRKTLDVQVDGATLHIVCEEEL